MTSAYKPRPPNKPKLSTKPNNTPNGNATLGLAVSQNELLKFQKGLRKTSSSFKERDNENNTNNNTPEFLKHTLKSPEERKKEAQHKICNAVKQDSSNNKPNPPITARKPPSDEELKVTQVEEKKSQDQISYEKDKMSLSSGAVRNSKMMFEQMDKSNKLDSLPRKRRTTSSNKGSFTSQNQGSFTSESSEESPKVKPKVPIPQKPNVPTKTVVPAKPSVPIKTFTNEPPQEIYDDVDTLIQSNHDNLQNNHSNQQSNIVQDLQQDDIYDDVENHIAQVDDEFPALPSFVNKNQYPQPFVNNNQYPPPRPVVNNNFPPPQAVTNIQQETYDDVSNITQNIQEEIYDDVGDSTQNIQQETYDDVVNLIQQAAPSLSQPVSFPTNLDKSPTSNITPNTFFPPTVHAPIKHEKDFEDLPNEKLIAPYGLEKWLNDMIAGNRHRFKVNPLDTNNNRPTVNGEVTEDDIYDDVDQFNAQLNESEKDREKREKREKMEKEKREKLERKKEKDEKKRKEKELKQFGLSPDVPLKFCGNYICQAEMKSTTSKHLSYQFGDEINVIEVAKKFMLQGKVVVLNSRDSKIGYVLKSDFGISEEAEIVEETRPPPPRPVSLIATEEDDNQEVYEMIPANQPGAAAPPVPETPRPSFMLPPSYVQGDEELYEEL